MVLSFSVEQYLSGLHMLIIVESINPRSCLKPGGDRLVAAAKLSLAQMEPVCGSGGSCRPVVLTTTNTASWKGRLGCLPSFHREPFWPWHH